MGLSSSQARLLSITARLTDNEYKSQQIANQRVKLSDISNNARKEYNDALNSDTFVFMAYNNYGGYVQTSLSPAALFEYQPNKNQYALVNTAGKALVDSVDAKNFRETDNLAEFLKRYECLDNVSQNVVVPDPTTYHDAPNPDYAAWQEKCNEIDEQKEKDRIAAENWQPLDEWDDEAERAKYTTFTPKFEWFYDESGESKSLYEMFEEASQGCYYHAINADTLYNSDNCYIHVLAHMLDLTVKGNKPDYDNYGKEFRSTVGLTLPDYLAWYWDVTVDSYDVESSFINAGCDKDENKVCDSFTPYMVPVSDIIRDGYDPGDGSPVQVLMAYDHPSSDLDPSTAQEWELLISDYYIQDIDITDTSNDTALKRLISNYTKDEDGNINKKTLRQKTIDMMFLVKNVYKLVGDDPETEEVEYDTTFYRNVMVPLIKTFQEDMQVVLNGICINETYSEYFDEEAYNKAKEEYENTPHDHPEFDENDPKYDYPPAPPEFKQEPDPTTYHNEIEERLVIIDPEKAQWYTNLWYRMNGYDSPEKVEKVEKETVNNRVEEVTEDEYILSLFNLKKVTHTENFEVLDKNLMASKDWLNNALSQGWITMERAGKTQSTNKFEYTWSSIIYSNATDIKQVEDEERMALAEVKYSKTVREIQAKDKKLQADMAKLDTEHNALQTQYQSIKSAIDKNVERSFKTFQG